MVKYSDSMTMRVVVEYYTMHRGGGHYVSRYRVKNCGICRNKIFTTILYGTLEVNLSETKLAKIYIERNPE